MDEQFKKVKELDKTEIAQFDNMFSPTIPLIRTNQVPTILTPSDELQQKTQAVYYFSGANVRAGFYLIRYDKKDEIKGCPVNVDRYIVSGAFLLRAEPIFSGHHCNAIPSVAERIASIN